MTKTRVKTELAAAIVLVLVGCFLLIAGILFGIDLHYRLEFHKIKAEVGADKIEDK